MEAQEMMYLGWILVAIAAVIAITFFYKKGILKDVAKMNPAIKAILVVILVVAGGGLIGWWALPSLTPTAQVTPTGGTTIRCATFGITPTVTASNGVLDNSKTTITIPFLANTTSHTVDEGDNTTWVNPVVTFLLSPEAYTGANADDLAVCHYEIMNPSQTVDSSSGTYYILTKSSNEWQGIWTGDGTHYVSGTTNMLFTTNKTLTLTLDIDETGLSYVQSTYDAQTLTIRFYNDCGWSYTVDIDLICTLSNTVAT